MPEQGFYVGVQRIITRTGGVAFIASPWRALADFMYTKRKSWDNLAELELDLKIDRDAIFKSDKKLLRKFSRQHGGRIVHY